MNATEQEETIRYGLSFVRKGSTPATLRRAQLELAQQATEMLAADRAENGSKHHNGKRGYDLGDVWRSRQSFADKPYRTEVMRSKTKGGHRGTGARMHGRRPGTRT